MKQKIFVVIPARNEEKNIGLVLSKIDKSLYNVVVVDDGSNDKTGSIERESKSAVLTDIVNLGKGAALKTGCDYAISKGADAIVVLDSDSQHDPADIPRFVEKLNGNDIVFGYRKMGLQMPFVLKFGNLAISTMANLLYGVSLKDTQSGFRAFTKDAYKKIRWSSTDYSMESEMIAKAGKKKLKYSQIPIKTVYSDKYKGTTVLDGIKIVANMIIWKITNINGA